MTKFTVSLDLNSHGRPEMFRETEQIIISQSLFFPVFKSLGHELL
jgi:hypothetical protein